MDLFRQSEAQEIVCQARPTWKINVKAEYPCRQGNAVCIWWDRKGIIYYERAVQTIDSF